MQEMCRVFYASPVFTVGVFVVWEVVVVFQCTERYNHCFWGM